MVSIVYMCLPPSPNSFHPLVPLGIHVCSLCQHLSALQLSLYHFSRFHIWVIPYSIYSSEMSFNSGFTSERKGSISFQGKELTDQRQRVETGRHDVKSAVTDGNGCWAVEPHDVSLTGWVRAGAPKHSPDFCALAPGLMEWASYWWRGTEKGDGLLQVRHTHCCSRTGGEGDCLLCPVYDACVCVSRCILTTVDPDTGVMSRKEPLETLKR